MSTTLTNDETEKFSIDPDSDFAANVDVINHLNSNSLETVIRNAIEHYNENTEYPISTKNLAEKATTVHEVLSQSQAVLVETSPGLVKSTCGEEDPDFDRFEPFIVAFPEYTSKGQMLFRGMAALSEVYHEMLTRNRYLEGELTPASDIEYTAEEMAQKAKKDAFTRYPLDSYYDDNNSYDHDGEYLDKVVIEGIHVCDEPIQNCLLVGSNDTGLYSGRGNFSEGSIMIGLDRLETDDQYKNKKVEIFSEYKHRNAFGTLSLPETGALYNQHFHGRWEADLSCIGTVVNDLANHDDISLVSIHPITEAAYQREYDPDFGNDIDGYNN